MYSFSVWSSPILMISVFVVFSSIPDILLNWWYVLKRFLSDVQLSFMKNTMSPAYAHSLSIVVHKNSLYFNHIKIVYIKTYFKTALKRSELLISQVAVNPLTCFQMGI